MELSCCWRQIFPPLSTLSPPLIWGADASRTHTLIFPALKLLHLPRKSSEEASNGVFLLRLELPSVDGGPVQVRVFIFRWCHSPVPLGHWGGGVGLAHLATWAVPQVLLDPVSLGSSQPFSLAHMSALPRHTSFLANLSVAALVKSHISC